jgi:regulator of nucleoside diphosphate kinase
MNMAERIYITKPDLQRLRSLVDQHAEGRDAAAAEQLSGELGRAIVIEPSRLPADVVTIESRVAFEEVRSGTAREMVLVYPANANPSAGRISVLAPVGAALLGLRTGDAIEWPLPDGRTAKIRILAVAQPAAARQEGAA